MIYEVIKTDLLSELIVEVNKKCADGYIPQGGIFQSNFGYWMQAMIKN